MKRGEFWWADLPDPTRSEPGFKRPVMVIQIDSFNRCQIATVVVVAITSDVFHANAPGNDRLPQNSAGLKNASEVNVSQIATLDKSFLMKKVGRLPLSKLAAVEEGLRLVLGL